MDDASPIPTAAAPTAPALAWSLLDVDGTEVSAQDPDLPFYAASTIKLHVLLAALRAADAGRLDLDTLLPATRTFVGVDGRPFTLGGDHLDPTHPAQGEPVAVSELLVRMIDRSSNEATDHALTLVGLDAVAAVAAGLGLRATRVERMIGDASALDRGLTNETSAGDLSRTLWSLVRGEGLSDRSHDLARRALAAQRIRIITRAVGDDVPHFSKSGSVDGFRHDVAAVGNPDGGDLCVLAVMTGGLPEAAADERIIALARELLSDAAPPAQLR